MWAHLHKHKQRRTRRRFRRSIDRPDLDCKRVCACIRSTSPCLPSSKDLIRFDSKEPVTREPVSPDRHVSSSIPLFRASKQEASAGAEIFVSLSL